MRRALVVVIFLAWAVVQVASEDREKPGICKNRAKREQCQCSPHGNDDCGDECSGDYDCDGARKCCTYVCKRVCTTTRFTPDFRCPPEQVPHPCPPVTEPECPGPLPPSPRPPAPVPVAPEINRNCTPRCVCRPGYVRREDGFCIKKKDCPPAPPPSTPICPRFHEIYYPCYQGCQASCANPTAQGCAVDSRDCVRGCFCAPGLVRNGHGRCVRPSTCPPPAALSRPPAPGPPICPDNQEFSTCRRECEPTCINKQPRGCFRRCQAGCFCKSPFVRDHYGNCVYPDQCVSPTTVAPRCNGPNEVYRFCSTKCQGTCDNPRAENCYARCQTGCFCADGYVRTDTGDCIPPEDCAPKLIAPPPTPGQPVCENDLEEYIDCYRGCQKTCDNPNGQGCDTNVCQAGCYCQSGLVRNHLGQCVPQHACENINCGYHEHFEECAPAEPECSSNYTRPTAPATGGGSDGCNSGCYCDEGYIRKNGDCVPTTQCRPRYQCSDYEDPVPCGNVCDSRCTNGFGSQSCPSSCRRRCCRRRFIRV